MVDRRKALEQYVAKGRLVAAALALAAKLRSELYDKQLAFVADPARFKVALCTRRAGKTEIWPRYATEIAENEPGSLVRIWGISRLRCKQLLWEPFKALFARQGMTAHLEGMHETELTMKFPNGSEIRLLGADKDKEVQKKRGDKTRMEIVLEAQLFGPYLRKLVEEVAEPCLFDLKGTFCMEGTPGPVCAGFWYEVSGREDAVDRWTSKGDKEGVGSGWSCHRWSVLDNPFLPHAKEELAAVMKRKNWDTSHPTYIREWTGHWVNDFGALFYKYMPGRNSYRLKDAPGGRPWGPGWLHSLGWDLGGRDDMALTVWGWHPSDPNVYEAFSWKKPGASAEEVMKKRQSLVELGFNFVEESADTGGGGKMYVDETMRRFNVVFKPAKKTEKAEHVRLMNDDFISGRIKILEGSALAQELVQLPIDPSWPDPENVTAAPLEDPRFPNHCADAGLYSWRAALHYLHERPVEKPKVGSPEQIDIMEKTYVAELERRTTEEQQPWWEPNTGDRDALDDDAGGLF